MIHFLDSLGLYTSHYAENGLEILKHSTGQLTPGVLKPSQKIETISKTCR